MKLNQMLHIYTRVSTQTQQDEGTSLDSQRELGIKKAQEMGFEYKVWDEGGASSKYEDFVNRPILLQLLSEIDKGNVKHLWVYNNDRLSRNDVTAHTIRVKLQNNAVTLYTNNGQFDLTNPQDGFLKTILDAVAQLDNAQRAERTRQGKLARVKQGFWMGGPPPYGYQITGKKLELHEEESQWVKKIYEWYDGDKSTEWIKSELDKSGVLTRRKKALWTLGSLQKILQNTHPSGHYTYTDSKTEETIQCTCPSIVSHTLWSACQDKRKQALVRRGQNNRTQRFYLLRNMMFCGHCGSAMSGRIKESKNEYLYYCPHKERNWVKSAPKENEKWKRGKGCSMVRSLNIKATDKLVKNEVMKLVINPRYLNDLLKKIHAEKNKDNNKNNDLDIKKLQNKSIRLTKELDNIMSNIADVETAKILGKQDASIADRILVNLNSVMEDTKTNIEQCKFKIKELGNDQDVLFGLRAVKNDIKGKAKITIDDVKMQAYLKSFIKRIEVYYDIDKQEHKLIIKFRIPLNHGEDEMILDLKKTKKPA